MSRQISDTVTRKLQFFCIPEVKPLRRLKAAVECEEF